MPNPLRSPASNSLGLLLVRLPLGALFCIKGYQKLATLGLANFVSQHITKVPKYMPLWFPRVYLNSLPFAEMALGAFIALGLLTRVSGFLTSCLLISFLMVERAYDPIWPFHPNFFFLGIASLLFFSGGGNLAVDAKLFGKKSDGFANRY